MDILIVTAELAPFCSDGEVGESIAALGRAIASQGHQVTFVLPKPAHLEELGLMVARRLSALELSDGNKTTVYDGQLGNGIPVLLVESATLQARRGAYADDEGEFSDNFARVAELAKIAEAIVTGRAGAGKPFDAVLGHGLAGALLPYVELGIPTVLAIHDPTQLGAATNSDLEACALLAESSSRDAFRWDGGVSLLRGGVLAADVVTCVSPKLALEYQNPDASPLAKALRAADKEIFGVAPGVDYAVYNPATDSALPTRFHAEMAERKGLCRAALCRELELDLDTDWPLFCWTGAVTEGSGAAWLADNLKELIKLPLRLVIAGKVGSDHASQALAQQLSASKYAKLGNFRCVDAADAALQRRVLAAADIALCEAGSLSGHGCRVAQRYGAVPVALDVPGASDAIVDCDAQLNTGSGFLFSDPSAAGFLGAVQRALAATSAPSFGKLRRRVMRQDLGWERAARRYVQLLKVAARKL
jgi:starch synthase